MAKEFVSPTLYGPAGPVREQLSAERAGEDGQDLSVLDAQLVVRKALATVATAAGLEGKEFRPIDILELRKYDQVLQTPAEARQSVGVDR